MKKINPSSKKGILVLLFAIIYMVSYITRINYGAVIVEMVKATGIEETLLQWAVTGSFITYGAGQVVSGVLGDKIAPRKLLSLGFILTVCMNFLIPICNDPFQMLVVWSINGFAQSFMWPPLVKIMTNVFHPEEYKKAVVKVSWGSSLGTIVVYLFSPLIISVFDWKAVFYVSGICGLVALLFWIFCTNLSGESDDGVEKVDIPKMSMSATLKMLFTPLMICVMIAIISQGMVRDGVTTWMPTYIDATYNLGSKISILSGVLLPIFSVLTFTFASILYRKKFTNPMACAEIFFSVGIVSCLMLVMFTGKSAFLSILCSAVLTGSMHAVNLILICMLPAFFKKYGNVSTASGVLNACTYIGSALSTFGISYIAKNIGWDKALVAWLLVVVLGTFMCFVSIKPWAIKYPNSEDQ